jgi:hypothetical protein
MLVKETADRRYGVGAESAKTAKQLAVILGSSKRKIERWRRVRDSDSELCEKVEKGEMSIYAADQILAARKEGLDKPIGYLKIRLDDPEKAYLNIVGAQDDGRVDADFIRYLGKRLLGIDV